MSTSTILPEWLDTARVRAIAMDMDRTILPESLELTPALRAAVGAAEGAGITPILATGRMFASARPYANQLGITAPVICYQGALVADPVSGEWLRHEPIDVPVARAVIAAVEAEGFHMNVYRDDQLYVSALNEEAITYAAHARLEAHVVGDLMAWLTQPTTKIVVVGEPHALDALQADLRHRFDHQLFIAKSLPYFLEIARPGVSKGAALDYVCGLLGIATADVIAFGDGANDIELLQEAGVGVAVADADPVLVEHADWRVAPVDEDGVANFVQALVDSRA